MVDALVGRRQRMRIQRTLYERRNRVGNEAAGCDSRHTRAGTSGRRSVANGTSGRRHSQPERPGATPEKKNTPE